jgi:hypothetical protein
VTVSPEQLSMRTSNSLRSSRRHDSPSCPIIGVKVAIIRYQDHRTIFVESWRMPHAA